MESLDKKEAKIIKQPLETRLFKIVDNEKCLFQEGNNFDDQTSENKGEYPNQDLLKEHNYLLVYYDKINEPETPAMKVRIFGDVVQVRAIIEKLLNEFDLDLLARHTNYGSITDSEKGYVEISTVYLKIKDKVAL